MLRFTTKRHIVRDAIDDHENKKEKHEKHDSSESNLPSWMLKDSGNVGMPIGVTIIFYGFFLNFFNAF